MNKNYSNLKGFYLKFGFLGILCFLFSFKPIELDNPVKKKNKTVSTKAYDPSSYLALTVSGYNADVIANGVGLLNTTTTNDVDGVNFCYLSVGTQINTSSTPTSFGLPIGGLLNIPGSDLFFQMASYDNNNSLRISQNGVAGESTITFAESNSYEKIHLAVTSGSGSSNTTFTINFSDATTQVISNSTIPDWFNSNALPIIISGIGRGSLADNNIENPVNNPRIYQLDLNIDPANQSKIVTSITVQKVSGGIFNLFAATGKLMPQCPNPTNIATTVVNTNGATISWSSANTNDAFEVALVNPGSAIPASGLPSSTNSYNFINLTPNTSYDVYIRTLCTPSGFSFWTGPFTFTTSCAPTNVPYLMNFETAVVPALPNCTSIQNVGQGNLWTVANNPGYGFTTKVLRYLYNGSNAANVWFFNEALNLTGGTTYTLSFDYGSNSSAYVEKLKIAYGTSANAAGMINVVVDLQSISNNTPLNSLTQFTPSTSGIYYFGFNIYSAANQYNLYVDNIAINEFLTTNSFDNLNFVAYPNPIKDVLNLSYSSEISSVKVINLLGQEIISKDIRSTSTQLDMSKLDAGAYIVNITFNDIVKSIKVIKK